jgi:hypothetical protein
MQNITPIFKITSNKCLTFSLKKEKVLTHDTTENHYSYIYSKVKTRNIYTEILTLIPKWKGAIIIYGKMDNLIKPIDFIFSEHNLKETFSKSLLKSAAGEMTDRYSWLENLLLSKKFKEILIFTTTSF